ncbi:MAG: carboxypeptidase-like regulatory domain-containing protein [Candidatus Kapabacteria bacterium]|nr:carboxypeptidase-like regulatory domain-containing protein [Candidatus Kapabacteria bacterium]
MRSLRSSVPEPMRLISVLIAVITAFACASAQSDVTIRGTVYGGVPSEPLRFVTVSELSTRQRVMTDRKGNFSLNLRRSRIDSAEALNLKLVFSCIGFEPDTILLPIADSTIIRKLSERPVSGREIVVTAEDPAVTIMRRVIARKQRQLEKLRAYTYTLYTKFIAMTDTTTAMRSSGRGDTTVNSILESFSTGYVELPDRFHNEIFQKRQTANVPPEANFVSFGTNLNIYDDVVTILGQEIASPLSIDAVDIYDYVLLNSLDEDTVKLSVKTKSSLRRGFEGTMYVDQRRNVPIEVQFTPNKAVNLLFDARLSYRQNLTIVDSMILPEALSISSTLEASILYVVAPRLDIEIETFCYDYSINPDLPKGVFDRRRVETTQAAAAFDSAYWQNNLKLPLRPEEQRAYREIEMILENPDSLQNSMFEQILGPVSRFLQRLARRPFTGFEDIFRYNLIHGPYLGVGLRDRPDTSLLLASQIGFGFADGRIYGVGSATWFPDFDQRWSLEIGLGRTLQRRDNPNVVKTSFITITSLFSGADYGDYYLSSGGHLAVGYSWGQLQFVRNDLWTRPNSIRLTWRRSADETVTQSTNWSLFRPSLPPRGNPAITDGQMSSLTLDAFLSYSPLRRVSRTGMALSIEAAKSDLLGGDFDFAWASWMGTTRMRTLPLWTLDLTASVRWSWGSVPGQRFISTESGFGGLVVGSAFRGMRIKEFYGDRSAALQFSHNFGEVIPGVLRIPNIASFGIEFLLFGGVQWTSFSPQTMQEFPTSLPSTDVTGDRTYYELGLGINRILLFLRLDFNARLSQRDAPEFRITLTNATF